MAEIIIRNYRKGDEAALAEIAYRTGYNGEDLTGRHYFDDQRLFYLIYTCYYPRYEPQHCFVAEDADLGRVVGYIIGTPDTSAKEERFIRHMLWRIAIRAVFVTCWRSPKDWRVLMNMRRMGEDAADREIKQALLAEYPAHLHINLLPGYQGLGIGTRLMRRFEEHLARQGIRGTHLVASNYNSKAVPFYEKMGFSLAVTRPVPHPVLADYTLLTFVKRIG